MAARVDNLVYPGAGQKRLDIVGKLRLVLPRVPRRVEPSLTLQPSRRLGFISIEGAFQTSRSGSSFPNAWTKSSCSTPPFIYGVLTFTRRGESRPSIPRRIELWISASESAALPRSGRTPAHRARRPESPTAERAVGGRKADDIDAIRGRISEVRTSSTIEASIEEPVR